MWQLRGLLETPMKHVEHHPRLEPGILPNQETCACNCDHEHYEQQPGGNNVHEPPDPPSARQPSQQPGHLYGLGYATTIDKPSCAD
jgi:hypothetical protein